MASKFYSVSVSWMKTRQHPPLVEGVLGLYGDWARFTADTWIIYTDRSIQEVVAHLTRTLTPEDFIISVEMAQNGVWGFAPQWLWNWIQQRASGAPPGSFPPLGNTLPPPHN